MDELSSVLDDVITFSVDFESHVQSLSAVLGCVCSAGLKLKQTKCQLFKSKVCFLGHIISAEGVLPNPKNTQKIKDWPAPKNQREVRAFLGLANYYRRFVKDFSRIARPMTQLLTKDQVFQWTDECQQALGDLKEALTSPEVMAYPRGDGEYILDMDACAVSIG